MKTLRSLLLTAAVVCCSVIANAQIGGQKFAYVDSDYILNNIPEYADAQEELNAMSTQWQNEVKAVYDKVSEMYKKYQTEMVLLSEDQKRAREQEIINKEQEAKNLQMQYFGAEGQLYQKREELVQPIQEKIYNALTELSQTKGYTFVFDMASGTSILYASERADISDDVLDQLSNVMQTVRREDRKRAGAAASSSKGSSSTGPKTSGNSGKAGTPKVGKTKN
ncbi:MAG: OmpH family outer membrane protein [Bacteroidales bacterium]|nr:OmpH family outer membrane protein [Bacteroidales bacterium]